MAAKNFYSKLNPPTVSEGSSQALQLESTLQELSLYDFAADLTCLGREVAHVFEQHPLLPGAILLQQAQFIGMISRHRLLEYLLRPHGLELFLNQPLQVLYSYARSEILLVPGNTPILVAAQQALRRSPELLSEPIVVQLPQQQYRLLDVHELNIAYWQIRGIETQARYERSQVHMIQSDKMASLGRLVDGVAHEILDPVSFIWGNLSHVAAYSDSLLKLLSAYEAQWVQLPEEIQALRIATEFDYLQEDLPRAISSIQVGAERLRKLALSLQNFCHIDEVHPKPADLNECLESILLLLKSRLTSEIQVTKDYGQIPPVLCYIGQLSQVFMNIFTNAIDALINQAVGQQLASQFQASSFVTTARVEDTAEKPRIAVTTRVLSIAAETATGVESRWVSICIADNGPGLSEEAQARILESFSVEKRAAKETSLAMSYQIVRAKHGGKFEMRSHPGTGTEFEILLPLV